VQISKQLLCADFIKQRSSTTTDNCTTCCQLKSCQMLHSCTKNRILKACNMWMTLKVTQGRWKWHSLISHISLPISDL